ncbi:MAG: hypothetical protein WCQ77_09280 [Planctomycetota bacterium]
MSVHRECGRSVVGRVFAAFVLGLLAVGGVAPRRCDAGSFPPSERILPATTRVWASIADPQTLRKRFEKSALGGFVYDPLMSTFLDGLRQQGKTSADPLRGSLEITLEEADKIAGGEMAIGVIERPDGLLATVAIIDTTGRQDAVKELLEAMVARAVAKGGKPLASPATMKAFVFPEAAPARLATGSTPAPATAAAPRQRQLAIALAPAAIVVGDRLDAVAELAAGLGTAGRPDSLQSLPAFAKVMQRCGADVPATAATVRWFVEPLAYLAADRRTFPPKKGKKGLDYIAILRRQGFDAVNGAGGYLFYGEGGVDLRHNTLIHAPAEASRPTTGVDRFQKAARMLHFPNAADMKPAPWVPGDAASWAALQWDIINAFDALPPLVDDVVGEAGVFDDVIASLKEDPDGPQIDVRGDLIKHLGSRCVVASDHVVPLGPDCERMLIAIPTNNPEAVAKVLAKGMASEGEVRTVEVGGHTIWETVKKVGVVPNNAREEGNGADNDDDASGRRRAGQRERKEQEPVWPNLSVAVAHGHIFLASHRDFLERVLAGPGSESLAANPGCEEVVAELQRLLPGDVAVSTYSCTERMIRPAYELLRAGRLAESKGLAGTMLRRLLEGSREPDGKQNAAAEITQKIDGSSLPEFDQVSRYFGSSGLSMQSTPDGWYFVGVGLWDGGQQPAGTQDAK